MSNLYADPHRQLQQQFGTKALADTLEATIVATEFSTAQAAFIEAQNMFFLSSLDPQGRPTVSYKGGATGFVKVLDDKTLLFPLYDGNGMFYSAGNMQMHTQVGLLFIDFQTPNRLRVQGTAELVDSGAEMHLYPGAKLVTRVVLDQAWVNCSRYVHKLTPTSPSPYVPDATGTAPVAMWKRIDGLQPLLSENDQQAVAALGTITAEAYAAKLAAGEVT
ncbi:MAG: pyridoxamine 5'-phosphate oxidase family protein [Pseudomonadota bacterium]